eukprot:scaffold24573_cov51-Isochrysis_galbana.AAC.1
MVCWSVGLRVCARAVEVVGSLSGGCASRLQLEPAVEAGARQRRCGRQPWRQVRLPVGEEVVCHPL